MPQSRHFKQVDVFTSVPLKGNPLAVIFDADDLSDHQMSAIARWTNLAETTFILKPTNPLADYRVRIFTPVTEFPFAGHPTLGTAHALLQTGLEPKNAGFVIQECGVGLVQVNIQQQGRLAFRAPEANIIALDPQHYPLLDKVLKGAKWQQTSPPMAVKMGLGWLVVRMENAQHILETQIDVLALAKLLPIAGVEGLTIFGPHTAGVPADYELRAFLVEQDLLAEDPVTGSANACVARLMKQQGFPDGERTAQGYQVRQGTLLQREGCVDVTYIEGEPWIGGHVCTLIEGQLTL